MKKQLFILVSLLFVTQISFAFGTPNLPNKIKQQNTGITFTENKGQVHDQNYKPRPDVLYGVMAGNMAVHIKKSGVSYQLYRVDKWRDASGASASGLKAAPAELVEARASMLPNAGSAPVKKEIAEQTLSRTSVPEKQTIYRIDLTWLNANTNFTKTEDEALPGYNNYYLESCPNGALNVKSYKGITLHNLYKGINLHYYEKNNELKHDYIVASHADYKQIQLKVEGAEISVNKDGTLILTTPLGKVQEGAPIVYQNGKQLKARWQIKNNILRFEIENYNPNYELIIDPITRLWGTYYGGTADDYGYSCSTDALGNVYMAGHSQSNTNIATLGSYESVYGGNGNAYLVKFDANGIRLWGTYYGGSAGGFGFSCTTDTGSNVYVAGFTSSNTGTTIATVGSHQSTYGGGFNDAFLVKFDANGIRLWGTYYGGTGEERGYCCVTDALGNVYLAGQTNSSTGTAIATAGSHQSAYGGNTDAFLVKFDANGIRQWGTYYGGTGDDEGYYCVVNAGNVYFGGFTNSSTGISTLGSHQSTYGGGSYDAFLVKFDGNGIRQWGTYYGGTLSDEGYSSVTDVLGNVYLSGRTTSNNGIATVGSHQFSHGGGISDAYLVKFNSSGIRQWGTYYGGGGGENGFSWATDTFGNIYMAGSTTSTGGTAIATTGSHQSANGGGNDAFLVKFNTNGVRQNATYYGGIGNDYGLWCSTDASGNLFMAGYTDTNSGTAIASAGSHQSTYGGGANDDAFLVKFAACNAPAQPSAINGNTAICSGSGANTYSIANVPGATSYTWSLPSTWSGSSNSTNILATAGSSGVFTVIAANNCGLSPQQTLSVTVNALPVVTASTSSTLLCEGQSAILTAGGAASYTFNPGGTGATITVSPTTTTSYTVTGTNTNGCQNTATITQNVDACLGITPLSLGEGQGVRLYPNPTKGIINLELSSNYEVTIVNSLGQLVCEAKLNSGIHQINLESLANGVYMIKMKNTRDSKTIKVIKE